jgi:hypothetical protein
MVESKNQRFLQRRKDILTLDLDTLEYRAAKRASFATLELTNIDKPINRFKVLVRKRKAGEFYRKVFWNGLCFEPYS